MRDFDALVAREFPALQRETVYLNSAATGPLPQRAIAVANDQAARRGEPWRYGPDEQFGILRRGRELVASLIGATPGEVALMVNTSYGINLAARSLPFARGDVIVASERDFPANIYPWMALASDIGAEFRLVPCRGRLFDEEGLLAQLNDPKVRALVVSWVSFESGMRLDLDRIGTACRERGVFLVVDAIQGLGPLSMDVSRTPIDILACGTQKWLLSPWGAGFVYVRHELVPLLQPRQVSWMSVEGSDDFTRLLDYQFEWRSDARRFEMITLPYQDFAVMNASLELLQELGRDRVVARIAEHTARLVAWAQASSTVELVTPAEPLQRAGIVSVAPRDPVATSRRLTDAGIIHSLREGAIRLSPHLFTPVSHLDRTIDVIDSTA
jgi:cysteine desulfurase / selenocysteine lyase